MAHREDRHLEPALELLQEPEVAAGVLSRSHGLELDEQIDVAGLGAWARRDAGADKLAGDE
jgi:hypothetical protein